MENAIQPFGEVSFEREVKKLGNKWEEYFFEHTKFVRECSSKDVYLIVGRRGSGKSTLINYFSDAEAFPNSLSINTGKAESYYAELLDIAKAFHYPSEISIQKLKLVWKYVIFQSIFRALQKEGYDMKKYIVQDVNEKNPQNFIKILLKGLLTKYVTTTGEQLIDLIYERTKELIEEGTEAILSISNINNLYVCIDSPRAVFYQ